MTAQTILPANSAVSGGFDVANSVRLDGNAYMYKDQSGGNRQKFTMSCWTKLTSGYGGSAGSLLSVNGTDDDTNFHFGIDHGDASGGASDSLFCHIYGADAFRTTPLLRDYSAWYHIVLAVDTTQAAAENRMKVYVNNVQQTLSQQGDYPEQNDNFGVNENGARLGVGTHPGSVAAYALNSYLCEYVLIDGSQLTPASFGEADEDSGIWKPIKVSGLTFGTNGFYLDFQASGNLGNDANGGTDLTEVSIAATDQSTDTCTNNFCTMNALDNFYAASTLSEGNLKVLTISGNAAYNPATFGLTKGKWYWEVKLVTCSAGDNSEGTIFGISNQSPVNAGYDGSIQIGDGFGLRGNGVIWNGTSESTGWNTVAVGNIVSVAVDFDNGKFYTATNGTYGNSSNPSTASNGYSFTVGTDAWFPGVNQRETSQTGTFELNFGSPSFAISSGNTDGNDYGNFEYAVPSGYYALNTKNLAEYG